MRQNGFASTQIKKKKKSLLHISMILSKSYLVKSETLISFLLDYSLLEGLCLLIVRVLADFKTTLAIWLIRYEKQ